MNDLISVVIPVYNVSKYLNRCLESICLQTYGNLEIITINDGSTDDSLSILNDWKKKDNRIIVIDKENGGLSSARNVGIEKATGKYIMFIDSDDFAARNLVEVLYRNIIKYNKKISICNRFYYFEDGTKKLRFKDDSLIIDMDQKEAFINLLNFINFDMSAWGKLYEISLFDKIRFPEGVLCEDYYIMYQLFSKTSGVVYSSSPLIYYLQQRKGSITKKNTIIYDYIYACKNQMDYICKNYAELSSYAMSSYCLSYFTVFNKALINGGNVEKPFFDEMKIVTKKYYKYVIKNKYIPKTRKIQVFIFRFLKFMYFPLLKIYKKWGL